MGIIVPVLVVPVAGTGDNSADLSETESSELCDDSDEDDSTSDDSDDSENSDNSDDTVDSKTVSEPKFRVGPVVKLRPVNDVIESGKDGLIEMYMDNPTVNEVNLSVDMRISVPAGIHVNGEGFGQAAAAGTVHGMFTVPPGEARTVYINVKADQVGTFTLHLSGLYYPENNKDSYYPISLTHPFTVTEASEDTKVPDSEGEDSNNDRDSTGSGVSAEVETTPGFGVLCGLLALAAVVSVRIKRKS
ncbi:hypothetical protein FTO70_06640 [Methanosarcina sp. KYL-1]|nr:hypothetical protein [Methanosarcina sp. KYL-1]